MENQKKQLLEAFISLNSFENWDNNTLSIANRECGFEKDMHKILFPGGVDEITIYLSQICNENVFEKLSKKDLKNLKIQEKAGLIIFEKIKEYHNILHTNEAVKKFVAYFTSFETAPSAIKNIFSFSSDAWYLIGDKSTDISYYTKRASLGLIYSKGLIYSISDESNNLNKTQEYVKRNIDGLMKFHKFKSGLKNVLNPNIFKKFGT